MKKEVDAVDLNKLGSLSDVKNQLPLTHNCIKESLRIYPPGYLFSREAVKATKLGAESIRKGSLVFISPLVIQRQASVFPQPEYVQPESLERPRYRALSVFTIFWWCEKLYR